MGLSHFSGTHKVLQMSQMQITPQPTEAELAAIMAAYEALWPVTEVAAGPTAVTTRWRFSGRWWMNSARPNRWGLS